MRSILLLGVTLLASPALAADVSQEAVDGCIDRLRTVGGPDGQSGTVVSTEFSEANSLVLLQDKGETLWRCLVSNAGEVAELSVMEAADDAAGAMSVAPTTRESSPEQVTFAVGTTGAVLSGSLLPGESKAYGLGAREGQFLTVRLTANGPSLFYQPASTRSWSHWIRSQVKESSNRLPSP